MKTELEKQIKELRTKLDTLAERVRLDAVARAFLDNVRGAASVRDGDFALIDGHPTRVRIADHGIGKWTFTTGTGSCLEAFRVPPSDDIDRLYTTEEVAEIVANVTRAPCHGCGKGRDEHPNDSGCQFWHDRPE